MTQPIDEILDERHNDYGFYIENARVADQLQYIMSGEGNADTFWNVMLPDQRQALILITTKISRILTGNFDHVDSWQDIAGYAQLIVDRLTKSGTYATDTATPSVPVSTVGGEERQPAYVGPGFTDGFPPIETAGSRGGAGS